MRKNILLAVAFIIFILLADFAIGTLIRTGAQKIIIDKRIGRLLDNQINTELIVFGSSRAVRDLLPATITRQSDISAFNFGVPGSSVEFHLDVVRLVKKYNPTAEYFVWVVDDASELLQNKYAKGDLGYTVDLFYPYANNPDIREILFKRNELNRTFAEFLYSYRQRLSARTLMKESLKGVFKKKLSDVQPDGSMPLSGRSVLYDSVTYVHRDPYHKEYEDENLVRAFQSILEELKNKKIIFIFPPNYSDASLGFADRIHELAGPQHVYLDYSTTIQDKQFYYDGSHLTVDGARILSEKIATDLKVYVGQ